MATDDSSKIHRLSVNMNAETASALREIADNHGVNITEAVRRAVSITSHLEREVRSGNVVQIENPKTGKVREILLAY